MNTPNIPRNSLGRHRSPGSNWLMWLGFTIGLALAGGPALLAGGDEHAGKEHHGGRIGFAVGDCEAGPHVEVAAEKKPGGRLFEGPLPEPEDSMAMEMDNGDQMEMGEESGAHQVHESRFGGAFMMAPNKVHHVEALYANECGFAVVLFNSHTEPIHVERFFGFINVKDQYGVFMSRFLQPNPDGTMLRTPMEAAELPDSFDIDLYLLFPGEQHRPELFNYRVDAEGHIS